MATALPNVRDLLLPALPSLCAGRCAEAEIHVDFTNDCLILHVYDKERGINKHGPLFTRGEIDSGDYKGKFVERFNALIGAK